MLLPAPKEDFPCLLPFFILGIIPHPKDASPRLRWFSINRRSKIESFTVAFVSVVTTLGLPPDHYTAERQKSTCETLAKAMKST